MRVDIERARKAKYHETKWVACPPHATRLQGAKLFNQHGEPSICSCYTCLKNGWGCFITFSLKASGTRVHPEHLPDTIIFPCLSLRAFWEEKRRVEAEAAEVAEGKSA